MKVLNITPCTNRFNTTNKYKQSFKANKMLVNDVFVKSQPAFKGGIITDLSGLSLSNNSEIKKENIPQSVKAFTDNLIMGADKGKYTLADINMLIAIHASGIPIEVKDIKTLKQVDEGTVAFCFPKYGKDGDLEKTYLFMNFDMPVSQTAKSVVHEFTHCLQFNTKEAKAIMKELVLADNGTFNYFNAFKQFESYLHDNNIHKRIDENVKTIGSMLSLLTSKVSNPLNAFNFNNSKLQNEYDVALEKAFEDFQIDDKDLALRYFKFRLSLEEEAYNNGANVIKQFSKKSIKQTIPYDLISKMYSDCVQYIDGKIKMLK